MNTTELPGGIDLDQLMAELDTGMEEFPEGVLRRAQANRDLVAPRLIEVLRSATAAARNGEVPEGNAHLFALFLLAEFRAREALPAILEAISLPGELPFDLFGDTITEDVGRILAALVDSPETLDALIRNGELNEYVRWEAAGTYLHLVRDGRLTREEAVARLHGHLREAIAGGDAVIAEGLVSELISYSPSEAIDDIREAFERELIDPLMISLEEVEKCIAQGKDARLQDSFAHCRPTGIEDTVEELRGWWQFDEPERSFPPEIDDDLGDFGLDDEDDGDYTALREVSSTIRHTTPRVGRNDPCPCGSGRKFKKCCGASK
jgi:hypothetical protein